MAAETVEATELRREGGRAYVSHGGFVPRLVAYVLDLGLLLIPHAAYLNAAGDPARIVGLALPIVYEDPAVWYAWASLAGSSMVYFTVLEGAFGRTVGKRLAGLRVTDLHMEAAGPLKAAIRNAYRVLYHVPVAGVALAAVDATLVLDRGQRLGDMAGDTLVIKVASEW